MSADPLWSAVEAVHTARFAVLGLTIELAATDPRLVELAAESFGAFAPAPPDAPVLRIDAAFGSDERSTRPPPAHALRHRERAGLFTATDGASVVALDLPSGRAAVFADAASEPTVIRHELIEALAWRFATHHGLIALHAACVIVDGTTLVLRGAGGAGKSTLAYAAARAGHTLVSEEVTWFDPHAPDARRAPGPSGIEPTLRGAPWRIGLEPSAIALFPELASLAPAAAAPSRGKLVVEHAGLFGGWTARERAPIGPIVFLEAPEAGWSSGSERTEGGWSHLNPDEAEARFLAGAIVGESAQSRHAYVEAGLRLIRAGAFALRPASTARAVSALEAIAAGVAEGSAGAADSAGTAETPGTPGTPETAEAGTDADGMPGASSGNR